MAQGTDAILSGTVTDASGAVVSGADVKAQNVRTGVVTAAKANEKGVYLFGALQPGLYALSAEQAGFKKTVVADVLLEVGTRLSINLALEVGEVTSSVEVSGTANELTLENASVGGTVTGQKIRELPLTSRNALSLVYIHAGLVGDNLSGARIGTLNITLDGMNVMDNRINQGVFSPIFASTDRVEEFRIVTAPADAELGRGSGQVQMITRSGTNQYHGSLFEFHRNTVLNANTWFNNQRGTNPATGEPVSPRNVLIRNQYGGRLGGPVRVPGYDGRNRTFFHVTYEAQKVRTKSAVTNTTFTETARRGIYRYFPGLRNGNLTAVTPTVDVNGNPVRPAAATGDLQSINLFQFDPNRSRLNPLVARMLELMPLPNNFRSGDGLNTAGYTWNRTASEDFAQVSLRLDQHFGSTHRASFSYTWEDGYNRNGFMPGYFPGSPSGDSRTRDNLYSLNVTSTLRPDLLNEFRIGVLRPASRSRAPWEGEGAQFLPQINGVPFVFDLQAVTDPIRQDNDPQGRITPVYQFSNGTTWLRGKHAFKGGGLASFVSSNGFNSFDVMPRAITGTGGAPILNLNTAPGIGLNLASAQTVLNDLAGSLARVTQALNSPGGPSPAFLPSEPKQRTWKQREFAGYFKDDWKVRPNLTLNLGVRYEFFGVPWDANGRSAGLVGGSAAIFGITGTSLADLFQPGLLRGQPTRVELVGPGSPNAGRNLYRPDRNNFAPHVGLSWGLPWFGKGKTVLRMGYSVGYERNSLRLLDVVSGDQVGLRELAQFTRGSFMDASTAPLPLRANGLPLAEIPLTDRLQTVRTYDSGLRTPYVQNFNVSIVRELAKGLTLDVRYVGNKGTRLIRGTSVNEINILENGILEAFRITQQGGHAPLFNRIFQGLNVNGLGMVNGTTITGSDVLRFLSNTQLSLSQHSVATVADFLNNTDQFTGVRGGLLRRAGLPENFIVPNPQFASARLTGNFASSTYHSLQVEMMKRFSQGWTLQSNYTWSKALGEEEGSGQEMIDSYRTMRNMSLDKRLMGFHRKHVIRNNGTWNLPVGPGKWLLRDSKGVVARVVEGWSISSIFNVFSGAPISITNGFNTFNTFGDNQAVQVGALPEGFLGVQRVGEGVRYLSNFRFAADPSVAGITDQRNIRAQSRLQAMADASGRLVFINPVAGQIGTLQPGSFFGPGSFRFDINLIKRIRLNERFDAELRADAIDAWNKPDFSDPADLDSNLNSPNFGRISGAGGNRIVVVSLRLNF